MNYIKMNKLKYLLVLAVIVTAFSSCKKDDDPDTITPAVSVYEYHAHLHVPNGDNKHVGDTLSIEVEFESHTGQPIHHINIEIKNIDDDSIIYSQPEVSNVNETDGSLTFEDSFILSEANGVTGHSDWKLTAKVWGQADGEEETSESVNFHVHP